MRVACVDVPALPLQLLWRRQPAWRAEPTVIVDEDRPQGVVQWACARARGCGVLPGHRYAHALGLVRELRAGVIPPEELAAAVDALARRLYQCSPEVTRGEDADGDLGTCWLSGGGLGSIYPSASAWGRAIAAEVDGLGLSGAVVVGFSRFATGALARAIGTGLVDGDAARVVVRVFACDADERVAARAVPLDRLAIAPRLRDELARLGVTTLGQMVQLPGGGVLERFGSAAHRLYTRAAGERWDPLTPEPPPEAIDEQVLLDDAERDAERLVFATKAALDRLLARLAARRRALVALSLEWNLQLAVGHHQRRVDCIKPAAPTLDGRALLGLVRLRLEHQPPVAGVVAIRVWADDVAATREQLALFAERPRRDLRAADTRWPSCAPSWATTRWCGRCCATATCPSISGLGADRSRHGAGGRAAISRWCWSGASHPAAALAAAVTAGPRRRLGAVGPRARHGHQHRRSLRRQRRLVAGRAARGAEPLLASVDDPTAPLAAGICREYHFADTRRGDCLWLFHDPVELLP
jgi:protein ImuB